MLDLASFDPDARISVEEALDRVLALVSTLGAETVPLYDALGRVLAKDVVSDIDVNPFDNSSMDGYAVIAADLAGASEDSPIALDVVGYIGAGSVYEETLLPGLAGLHAHALFGHHDEGVAAL